MKKSIVVGGSNGIGLSIVKELLDSGYFVYILDINEPDFVEFNSENIQYIFTDLNSIDPNIFINLSKDKEVELLMITAGFGRVAHFSSTSISEIRSMIQVNTIAGIEIVKYFYDRISSKKPFYSGMMVSISGMVSSPLFATYSASKGALTRFIESINVELEMAGTENRILNVSPGSLKGTKFNGGGNDPIQTKEISHQILINLINKNTLYIPDYEEVYKGVLNRYQVNPYKFGLDSYHYKISTNRINDLEQKPITIGYLSGTFDLFHVGHLNLFKNAKKYCDYLIVGVHPDASHKGKETVILFEERKEIVGSNKYVDKVVTSTPEDHSAWELYHYNYLFVGSDYKGTERFNRYEEYFSNKDTKIVYFPYTKGISSTQIRDSVSKKKNNKG